jgi:predicted phosphodiesterase
MVRDMMNEHEIFILGHTHQPSLTRYGTKVVVNLGAHMRGFSDAWIEIEKEDGDLILAGRTRTLL